MALHGTEETESFRRLKDWTENWVNAVQQELNLRFNDEPYHISCHVANSQLSYSYRLNLRVESKKSGKIMQYGLGVDRPLVAVSKVLKELSIQLAYGLLCAIEKLILFDHELVNGS